MKVKNYMRSEMHILEAGENIRRAAAILTSHPHHSILLLNREGLPERVLTQEDILRALADGCMPDEPAKRLIGRQVGKACLNDELETVALMPFDCWVVYDAEHLAGLLQRSDFSTALSNFPVNFISQMEPIIDCIDKPILVIDNNSNILLCNKAACQVIHRSKPDIIALPVTTLLTPSRPKKHLNDGNFELTQKFTFDDKTYVTNWAPIIIHKKIIASFAILRDITKYEFMSSELERVRLMSKELNAIIESSFDGIYVTDGESKTLRINKAYERITGIKSNEVVGHTMQNLVAKGLYNDSATLRVLEEKRPITIVQNIMKTDKTIVVTGNPIFDDDGNIFRVVTNVRDVTELNQLQEKIKKMEQLQSRYEMELQQLRKAAGDHKKFVIKSQKMLEIYDLALKLAKVDSTILIQGDSGVGKEVFSEIVHNHGARRKKPFIKISCAAIPENLLESELFGYAPGAFTDASRDGRAGIFEMADGGTIFLDEIGEMPMGLQVKLLRVLQQREIVRIGGAKPIQVDTRIMAATNRDLEEMIKQQQFRKDLFFRLNVVPVLIPPLRERKEAISHFIYFFIEKYNRKYGFSKQITSEVIDAMIEYDWPGNVRELENMIERLVVMAQGEVITARNLPEKMKAAPLLPSVSLLDGKPLKVAMAEFEHRILSTAIQKHGTSRKVAAALGINQSTVVRKANRLGIQINR